MSLRSSDDNDVGSEGRDQFDDLPPTSSPRLLGLVRQLSQARLTADDHDHSPDPDRRTAPSHSRQLSRYSSRRSLQDEHSRILSTVARPRTDDLLSEIVEDELRVRRKFARRPRSRRDPSRSIDQILYDDAAAIRARREQLRLELWTEGEAQAARAGATPDSNLLLLRARKRTLLVAFDQFRSNRHGALNRASCYLLLDQLGVVTDGPKAERLFARLWALMIREPGAGADGIAFATFYRYTIVILFPILLPLLSGERRPPLDGVERQIVADAASIPNQGGRAFDAPLPAAFLGGLARALIENTNLQRLLRPIRPPLESSDDDFEFRPEITPRSERLAGRQRHCSGRRRFSEELQEYARQAQRRRDADEARKFETELSGCTFRPALNDRRNHNDDDGRGRRRFQRLYEIGVHRVEERRRGSTAAAADARSASPPYRQFRQRVIPAAVLEERPMPRGFQATVERWRRAFRQRQRRQAERDQLGQQFVDRYDRRERRASLKAAAAADHDDDHDEHAVRDPYARWYRQQLEGRRRPPPLLYVDVKVGPGRTGRLAIFADSDANRLSFDFARIFDLDRRAQARLKTELEQHCRRVQRPMSAPEGITPAAMLMETGE